MKKSIHVISATILALGLSNAWAADPSTADKPGMGNMDQSGMQKDGMQKGEMKGMNMDKEHMDQMHKHMDEMHKSNAMGDATKCDMKSDSKCGAKDMKSTTDKSKAPANADDHSAHHE